jgi:hypothetical protein
MLFLIVVITVLVIGIALLVLGLNADVLSATGLTITILAGLVLLGSLIGCIAGPMEDLSMFPEREIMQQTLDISRANESDLERATITKDIIDFNKRLADKKYWYPINSNWFGCFRDQSVLTLEPIE